MIDFEVAGVSYKVKKPNSVHKNQGRKIYLQAYNQAIAEPLKCMVKAEATNFAKVHGLWTPEKEAELAELNQKLDEGEKILAEGGIELSAAKNIALEMRENRTKLMWENISLSEIFSNTAERQGEFAETQYLMSVCICQKNGMPAFKDLNDFLNRYDEEFVQVGISKYNELMYGSNADYFKELPENKFLIEYGFMDQELNLLDENGNKVEIPEDKVERKPFLKDGAPVEPVVPAVVLVPAEVPS